MLYLDPETRAIPLILCSAATREVQQVAPSLASKGIVWLEKPFELEALLNLLDGIDTKPAHASCAPSRSPRSPVHNMRMEDHTSNLLAHMCEASRASVIITPTTDNGQATMDLDQKLDILAPAARFDACDTYSQSGRRYQAQEGRLERCLASSPMAGPDGKKLPTFRLLMSSKCEWNCPYCPLRAGSDMPRAALAPEELARVFLPRYQRGAAQGLFLSTGVDGDAHAATGRMLDGVEQLRKQHAYTGYVHLKLLPGAARDEIERAARLADRLSINLEAPSAERLARISPERDWAADVIARLAWARDWQREGHIPAGLATQFVVGAAGESDRELLLTTTWLYRELELRRVYFGAFRPALGTPLEGRAANTVCARAAARRGRLAAAALWLHDRGAPYSQEGDLPLHLDPKLAWALAHPERFPIELNTADQELLLRVPGLGPLSVRRILRLRSAHRFRDPEHLKGIGGALSRARDFITLDGRFFGRNQALLLQHYAPRGPIVEQLTLW